MSTISLFMIKGFIQIKLRNEEFNLGTAVRVIEVDTVSIRSFKMADNMQRIDKFFRNSREFRIRIRTRGIKRSGRIRRLFKRLFDIEFNNKLREDVLDFRFKSIQSVSSLKRGLELIFAVIVEEEVNHLGVLTGFAKAIILTIFKRNVEKLLMRREFNITIESTSREDDLRIRINIFGREFNVILKFFKKRFRATEIIHI